ncbi:MAG: hypothetical protein ABIH92_01670 [Nanoarchaeota archaeon]
MKNKRENGSEIEVKLNLAQKSLVIAGRSLRLNDEFVEAGMRNGEGEETVLMFQYAERSDEEGPAMDDAENIYNILKDNGLSERYEVSSSFPVFSEGRYTPYVSLEGRMKASICSC